MIIRTGKSAFRSKAERTAWYHVALGVAVSLAALCGWRASLEPMPTHFEYLTGVISSAEVRRYGVEFFVAGREFDYPSILPETTLARSLLKPGNTATVGFSPADPSEVWALTVNERAIVQPNAAHRARLSNGKIAFWLFVVFSVCTGMLGWRFVRQSR
ncbi:hypothetical protein [Lysobacter sp. CA196]|uniref:hypothetical protein n=1 Tax=Lysobacter sp. CA196 TaxID=3455606 RepID=UPI003F8D4317